MRCQNRAPLTDWDRELLGRLATAGLPPPLEQLRLHLIETDTKAEQEEVLRATGDQALAAALDRAP